MEAKWTLKNTEKKQRSIWQNTEFSTDKVQADTCSKSRNRENESNGPILMKCPPTNKA